MKAIIIEDEKPAAERLKNLIEASEFDITVLTILDSIRSSVQWFNKSEKPDLVFLDIHLADGSSFEIFKSVDINVPIIFTTAYDEYALKAFEQNCIDYLLKPINREKLNKSLAKMNQWMTMGSQKLVQLLEQSLKNDQSHKTYKERFLVKGKGKFISIKSNQIAYFQSINKIVLLVTHENRSFPVDHTLEELEGLLDPNNFFRLNRSVLANLHAIGNIESYFNGKLIVWLRPELKDKVVVSRDKAKMFKVWMGE